MRMECERDLSGQARSAPEAGALVICESYRLILVVLVFCSLQPTHSCPILSMGCSCSQGDEKLEPGEH